jgi:hypothetical protein
MNDIQDYYNFIMESDYTSNVNKGIVMTDKPQAGLAFNTGPMYNNQQVSTPNTAYADGTQTQSNAFGNPKNNRGAM